ncbi:hypothetical protein ACJRO7_019251 [Eucalyptus globulus]|uniref:Uncharacterized protein n=1 Tax=Eucalyptus globulus TaxID=34317 RepID=A0ABD3KDB3_EUCGL
MPKDLMYLHHYKILELTLSTVCVHSQFVFPGVSSRQMITAKGGQGEPPQKMEFPLNCTNSSTVPQTCLTNYPTKHEPEESYAVACPEYFGGFMRIYGPGRAWGSRER